MSAISVFFFFNDTATTEIYTLSLHDALPICTLAAPPSPDRQLFICVEPVKFLVVHYHAFTFQQHADPPVTKPTAFACNLFHFLADFRIVRRTFTPNSFRIDTNELAGPALRDAMIQHCPERCITPLFR